MPCLKCSHSLLGRLIGTRLANDKPCGREVSPQDNEAVMIKLHEARVSRDGFLQTVHGTLSGIHPDWCNRINVITFGNKLVQRSHTQLKVVNEFAVELNKPNELANVSNQLGMRPSSEKLMLGLCWAVLVGTDIFANKLKSFGED